MDTNENITATPTKRGYWAGFKDVKQLGRLFWVFVACYCIWLFCNNYFRGMLFVFFEKERSEGFSTFKCYKYIIGTAGLVVLGSVVDWLGIRRSLTYIFGAAIILCCFAFAYLFIINESPSTFSLVAFFSAFAIMGELMVALQYKAFRRYVQQTMWPQAESIILLASAIFIPILFAVFMILVENIDFPGYALIIPILFFSFCIILVLKNFKQQNEFIGSNEDQLVKNDEPPVIVARPKSPFSGFADILKSDKIKQALLFSFSVLLLYFLKIGSGDIVSLCWTNNEDNLPVYVFTNHFAWLRMVALFVVLPLLLVSFPILGRIKTSFVIKICAVFYIIAVIFFLIPTDGETFIALSLIAQILFEIGDLFLGIFYIVYVLNATPVGREGSMLAVLGVVWLLTKPLIIGIKELIDNQKNADWTYTFTEAINADASNAHALWLIVLVPVALGTILLFVFNRYLFDEVV